MKSVKTLISSALIAGACFSSAAANAEMVWSDNSLSLLHNVNEYQVNDHDDVVTVTLEHASGHNWGDLFFFADRLDFKQDADHVAVKETYSELSPRLSLSYVSGQKLAFGVISDVFLATTWEHSTLQSSVFSNSFDNYLVGVGADLTLPGFAYANINVYQANNEQTDNDQQLTFVWGYPFSIGHADFMFDGYIDWSSAEKTHKSDFHFNPQLRLDVGKYFGIAKKIEAGFEYSYWNNKFGLAYPGLDTESAFSLLVKVHL